MKCAKLILIASLMIPLSFCALSVGVLFGCYSIGAAKNPEESETLFNNCMTAFVLIETFSFIAIMITVMALFAF